MYFICAVDTTTGRTKPIQNGIITLSRNITKNLCTDIFIHRYRHI